MQAHHELRDALALRTMLSPRLLYIARVGGDRSGEGWLKQTADWDWRSKGGGVGLSGTKVRPDDCGLRAVKRRNSPCERCMVAGL
jgi:hypothetical protein